MFIDFEGIDGSGKTTLSNKLAHRLQRLGYRVAHAREGGELQSPTARRVRDLTRDAKLLEMSAQAEFFLNLARDAQQLDEVIKPALARGEVCISDRYLYSQLALSAGGRGLSLDSLKPAVELASQGIWPDLVILVDVDPDLARLRKRLGKLSDAKRAKSDSSRKGLAGAGLSVRVREFFLAMARKDPSRWLVIENNDQPLWALEQRILDLVLARLEGREVEVSPITPNANGLRETPCTLANLEERFFARLDDLEVREPALAAYLVAGIPGLAAHKRRLSLAERFPQLVARGLSGQHDEASDALRRLLAARCPNEVVESLGSDPSPKSMALRAELFDQAPAAVVSGLRGNDSAEAWELRKKSLEKDGLTEALLTGLARVDSAPAWELRAQGLRKGMYADVARSLAGITGATADEMREVLFRHDRLAVIKSITGLDTAQARRFREKLFEKAPKAVLRSLAGVQADYAFEMRERAAPYTKEALDSVDGMDAAQAWSLRERFSGLWPSTAISSLKGLAATARGQALIEAVLARHPARLSVIRNAFATITVALDQAARPQVAAHTARNEANSGAANVNVELTQAL